MIGAGESKMTSGKRIRPEDKQALVDLGEA